GSGRLFPRAGRLSSRLGILARRSSAAVGNRRTVPPHEPAAACSLDAHQSVRNLWTGRGTAAGVVPSRLGDGSAGPTRRRGRRVCAGTGSWLAESGTFVSTGRIGVGSGSTTTGRPGRSTSIGIGPQSRTEPGVER